jgi:hypothetical protein
MRADTHNTRHTLTRLARRWIAVVCAAALLALAGCRTDKEVMGTGVSKGKNDPLVHGPTRIPRQDLPVPDRATGPKGKADPLTTPTGGKAGYSDDPERFKGTFIPGKPSTPAALAGRFKDGEELKIDDGKGVALTPGGTLPGGIEPPEDVEPLLLQLEKLGVSREDRTLERENGKFAFRASVPITRTGARRQYVGVGLTARDAVKQVLDQIATDPK